MKNLIGFSISLALILLVSSSQASNKLKSKLKLNPEEGHYKKSPKNEKPSLKSGIKQNKPSKLSSQESMNRRQRVSLGPGDPDNLALPFTVSPYYEYLDAFLLGLKLENYVDYSTECIDAVCYTIDDWYYLQNNITLTTTTDLEGPILNVTQAIAGNFSESVVQCEQFTLSMFDYTVAKYAAFNNDVGEFLLAFVFNLMGQSLRFKSIFDEIQDDMANQYYTDIATQYGRLVRIMFFEFDPTTTSALLTDQIASFLGLDDTQVVQDVNNEKRGDNTGNYEYSNDGNFKTLDLLRSKQDQILKQISELQSNSNLAVGYAQTVLATVQGLISFNWETDILNVMNGFLAGGVNVYPDTSLVAYCQGNATEIYDSTLEMISDFQHWDREYIEDGLGAFSDFTDYIAGTAFNCYFSFTSPAVAAGYTQSLSLQLILWNILFNLGYMYTDGKNIYTYLKNTSGTWYNYGYNVGDFLFRFLYSRYVPRSYYSSASRFD